MTFESTPANYSSINDSLIYVVYDAHAADSVTYPNYKYVAEIWINGTQVFTGKYFPNPTTNRGIMDFSTIIREYCIASLSPTGTGILAQELSEGSWRLSVVIKMREEYSGTVGSVILTDSTRIFYNHYNARKSDFTILSSYTDKPLSNRSTSIDLQFTSSNFFIPYFATTTTPFNVVITGGTSTRTKTITPTTTNTIQLLNISPVAINNDYAGNFTSSTSSYTVQVGGITYNVNVVCDGLYSNFYVHFLNKFGGFETMLFNKVSKYSYEAERKTYQQLPYRVSSSGVVSVKSGSIMYQQKTEFAGRIKEKLKVSTDWLSDTDYQWLSELVCSPIVYIEDTGTLYPVIISDTNYEFKKHIVDGLVNLSINVEFGSTYKTQFQ
jgi:hypothetical protein